jgi:hypothetical protein
MSRWLPALAFASLAALGAAAPAHAQVFKPRTGTAAKPGAVTRIASAAPVVTPATAPTPVPGKPATADKAAADKAPADKAAADKTAAADKKPVAAAKKPVHAAGKRVATKKHAAKKHGSDDEDTVVVDDDDSDVKITDD